MNKKIFTILAICLLAIGSLAIATAADPTDKLSDHREGISVEDGKLINDADKKEIGTVKMINSTDEGEDEIYGYDSQAIEKYVSDKPLVKEYIVEDTTNSSNSGIYWMFGHDGKIFLAFVPTENMGNGMLDRMTEFCKAQGVF